MLKGVIAAGAAWLLAAGAAQARIVHDGACASGYSSQAGPQRTCVDPQRIVHDARCTGPAVADGGEVQCLAAAAAPAPLLSGASPQGRRLTFAAAPAPVGDHPVEVGCADACAGAAPRFELALAEPRHRHRRPRPILLSGDLPPFPPKAPTGSVQATEQQCDTHLRSGGVCVKPDRIVHDVDCGKMQLGVVSGGRVICVGSSVQPAGTAAQPAVSYGRETYLVTPDRVVDVSSTQCPGSRQAVAAFGVLTCLAQRYTPPVHARTPPPPPAPR